MTVVDGHDYEALVNKLVAMSPDAQRRWVVNCAPSIDMVRLTAVLDKRMKEPAVRAALLHFADFTDEPPPSSAVDVLGDIMREDDL